MKREFDAVNDQSCHIPNREVSGSLWQSIGMDSADFDQFAIQRESIFDRDFLVTLLRDIEYPFHNVSSVLGI